MNMKTYQLPKEFAAKWVAALRSGEYKQCDGQLASPNGYCCLGVACKAVGASDDVLDNRVSREFNDHRKEYWYIEHDVYNSFKNNSHIWTYRIRTLVKSWFVNTIGILVLKGKLIVLPIIEIED